MSLQNIDLIREYLSYYEEASDGSYHADISERVFRNPGVFSEAPIKACVV